MVRTVLSLPSLESRPKADWEARGWWGREPLWRRVRERAVAETTIHEARRPTWRRRARRDEVVARGTRALDDMRLHGIKTTANYYKQILQHPDFRAASFNTSFVPEHPELLQYSDKKHPSEIALALAAAIAAHAGI